ncbi:rap guanine nucleotide exchange factor 3-like [Clupea harengus]|nr:rap guanine nucleotide exchange factor 3-like [Clupea harengus]
MNSFTAVMYGLTNSAVSRLHKTWKKVPNKMKKRFRRYEHMLDPFSNHEAMRQVVAKLSPPYIPYLPLILKDLTFIHEGNKSYRNGLVNFEKMSMIAKNLRTVKDCRNQPYLPISPQNNLMDKMFLKSPLKQKLTFSDQSLSVEGAQIICLYIRNLKVIDDQRKLSQLSRNIEP